MKKNKTPRPKSFTVPFDWEATRAFIDCKPIPNKGEILVSSIMGDHDLSFEERTVSDYAQSNMRRLLRDNNLPELPNNFNWHWRDEKGTTLPKRIKTYYQRGVKIDIPKDLIAKVGSEGAKYGLGKKVEYFLTVYEGQFDWGTRGKVAKDCYDEYSWPGFFGQRTGPYGGSCWWGTAYLSDGHPCSYWYYKWGGSALLLYSDKLRLCSDIGRAWIFNYSPKIIVVSNAKGSANINEYAEMIMEIFSDLPLDTKHVSINNNNLLYGSQPFRVAMYDGAIAIGLKEDLDEIPKNLNCFGKKEKYNRIFIDPSQKETNRQLLVKKYKNKNKAKA